MPRIIAAVTAIGLAAIGLLAEARTFRWSSQGDYLSADPMAAHEALTNGINSHVYEYLVIRGPKLEILPGLAVRWRQTSDTTWVFDLRKGVKWHDGSDFTADDVVFSVKRGQGPTSSHRVGAQMIGEPRKVDDHTVELRSPVPNPLMPEWVIGLGIMNKAWCERHGVQKSQDFLNREETYASRNAMGTGPYMLVSREPDVKTVFKKNPRWWGLAEPGYFTGNVEEVVYFPIKQDSSRMAALLAGNIDFVLDPPLQDIQRLRGDPRVRILEGIESRVIFLAMDQARDELLYSSVKGRNPFKDRRVRQAFYQAIDVEAIHKTVMRGMSIPTAVNLPNPRAMGVPAEMDKRYPFDPVAARRLLAEAGYPDGFELILDCPNNRYVNDEKICVAVAGMLAKIGIRVKVNAMPRSVWLPKIQKLDTSFVLLGWGSGATDALFTMQYVLHSRTGRDGDFNVGGYQDAEIDAAIAELKSEPDPERRKTAVVRAMRRHHEQVYHIPLHLQVIPWAMRDNVDAVHRANNELRVPWVRVR